MQIVVIVTVLKAGCKCVGTRLCYKPYIKDTARHLPLSWNSWHSRAVHVSWPINEMRRLHLNASRSSDSAKAREAKISRWKECLMDPAQVTAARNWSPRAKICWSFRCDHVPTAGKSEDQVIHLVIDFHPVLVRGLQSLLSKFLENYSSLLELTCGKIKLALSCRKAGQHLVHALRMAGRRGR